jgi:manganese/zinc/iron transport system substrate-binding protein
MTPYRFLQRQKTMRSLPHLSDLHRLLRPALLAGLTLATGVFAHGDHGEATPEPLPPGCDAPVLNVVATVGMVADLAVNIGGSCVTVTAMMGPGVDPHLYSATQSDVELLFEADVIYYGGLNLEARLIDVFEQASDSLGIPVVAVSETIPAELLLTEPGLDVIDPHVWMDVSLWQIAAGGVADSLIALLPDHAEYLAARAARYDAELTALDTYVAETLATIPEGQRVLVTAHDAFNYYGNRYAIDVFAPQGITTQAEVGVADIRRTIDLLVERGIPAVFIETSISPDVIEAIQEGAEARGHTVTIGGELFSDAMGGADTPEGTYIGMIRANTDTIARALGGTVPDAAAESGT